MTYVDWNSLLYDGSSGRHWSSSSQLAWWSTAHVNHQITDMMIDVTQRVQHFRRQITQTLSTCPFWPLPQCTAPFHANSLFATTTYLYFTPSLRFNGHFPSESGLAGFTDAKNDGSGSSSQIITINKPTPQHPMFYKLDALPVAQKNNISHSKVLLIWGGLPTLSLTTKGSWLTWRRAAKPPISPLMTVPWYISTAEKQ